MKDLFGHEIVEVIEYPKGKEIPKGYAARPGTGPAGEECRTCDHLCRIKRSKTYLKCALRKRDWSGCYATDIRAHSPACKFWTMRWERIKT